MSSVGTAKAAAFGTLATRARVLTTKPALVAGFVALALYLATPTANYYWDGLERTIIYFADRNSIDRAFQYFNKNPEWHEASPTEIMRLDDEIEQSSAGEGGVCG